MLFTWMPEPTYHRPDERKSCAARRRISLSVSSRLASSPAPFFAELANSRSVPFAPHSALPI